MRKTLLGFLLAVLVMLPFGALSQVTGISVIDTYRDSLVLRWPTAAGVDRYMVQAFETATHNRIGEWWVEPTPGKSAIQVQPLTEGLSVDVVITPYTSTGAGTPGRVTATPDGSWERGLDMLASNGGFRFNGFEAIPDYRVDDRLLFTRTNGNHFLPELHPDSYGHSGAHMNMQRHWHISLGDNQVPGAVAAISTRIEQPFDLSLKRWPYTMFTGFDAGGHYGRSTFYFIVSNKKLDLIALKPVESDMKPVHLEGNDTRIQGIGDKVIERTFVRGVQTDYKEISRGKAYNNVRQRFGIRIWKDRIEYLIDREYDGIPEIVHTIPADMETWGDKLWLYFTFGSYNVTKTNLLRGQNNIHQIAFSLWHLEDIGMDGASTLLSSDTLPPRTVSTDPLDWMPSHSLLNKFNVPSVFLTFAHPLQANKLPDVFPATVRADNKNSRLITGSVHLLSGITLGRKDMNNTITPIGEVALAPVLNPNEDRLGLHSMESMLPQGKLSHSATFQVDTRTWAEGYYQLQAKAFSTVPGAFAVATNASIYTVDYTDYILISRRPYNGKPADIAMRYSVGSGGVLKSEPGVVIPVYVGRSLCIWSDIISKSLLQTATLEAFSGGQWKPWSDWHPAKAVYTNLPGGNMISSYLYDKYVESWWPRNAENKLPFRIRAIDADGIETIYPFTLHYQN